MIRHRAPRFLSAGRTSPPRLCEFQTLRPALHTAPEPAAPSAPAAPAPATPASVAPAPPAAPASAPLPAADTRMVPAEVAAERLAGSIEVLRGASERLAEQARADALEIGVRVARRVLERELTTGPEPLLALVRSAVQRAGSSRTLLIRLHPADETIVRAAGRPALGVLAATQVRLAADTSLSRGDCLVEADFGQVDGRLSSRIEEVRRALEEPSDEPFAAEGDAA